MLPDQNEARLAIAGRLRIAREMAGLSQGQVARLLGLQRPSISEVEAGRRRVSADEIAQLANIYSVSSAWLVEGEETDVEDPTSDRVLLAARELKKLSQADLDRLLRLLSALRYEDDPSGNN